MSLKFSFHDQEASATTQVKSEISIPEVTLKVLEFYHLPKLLKGRRNSAVAEQAFLKRLIFNFFKRNTVKRSNDLQEDRENKENG